MMRGAVLPLLVAACLAAGAAQAECRGETLVDCQIAGKDRVLSLCLEGDSLQYSYGKAGAPELELTRDVTEVLYEPWNGIGRTMWEAVALENDGVTYRIYTYADRMFDVMAGQGPQSGTELSVERDGQVLATLACEGEGLLDFNGVGRRLVAKGYCRTMDGWREGAARGSWYCE